MKSSCDSPIELLTLTYVPGERGKVEIVRGRCGRCLQLCQCATCQAKYFERALDALTVIRENARSRLRVDFLELFVQLRPPFACGTRIDLRSNGGVGTWQRRDPAREC